MIDDIHVMPVDDLVAHAYSDQCWCAPTRDVDEPRIVVHHAADMREYHEPDGPVVAEVPRG